MVSELYILLYTLRYVFTQECRDENDFISIKNLHIAW